jgi:hypothetical protein
MIIKDRYATAICTTRSRDMGMVLNATFSNISDISWLSDLLVEETGVP